MIVEKPPGKHIRQRPHRALSDVPTHNEVTIMEDAFVLLVIVTGWALVLVVGCVVCDWLEKSDAQE